MLHVPQFGRLKYVHVSVDTLSGAMFASTYAGEKAKDASKHFLLAFATLGVPAEVKMDNGPAYVCKQMQEFFSWGIRHSTGIPHSPPGQSIVERAHQTIKRVLDQQQGGTEVSSPIVRLCKALFTINFLKNSFSEPTPPHITAFFKFDPGQIEGTTTSVDQRPRESSDPRALPTYYLGEGVCVCFYPFRIKVGAGKKP